MFCINCGYKLPEDANFCKSCGKPTNLSVLSVPANSPAATPNDIPAHNASSYSTSNAYHPYSSGDCNSSLVGFSSRINDPAFAKYIKNSNRWSWIFSVILALIAMIGFFIYGETGSDMRNPQALFIGMGVGGMFILVALIQIARRMGGKTWEGNVVDKKAEKKHRQQGSGDDDSHWVHYMLYTIVIKDDSGKKRKISIENNDILYNYYQVGDRLRFHPGLNTYEKYDKSKDSIIFCNACGTRNNITEDACPRCKCPLLK